MSASADTSFSLPAAEEGVTQQSSMDELIPAAQHTLGKNITALGKNTSRIGQIFSEEQSETQQMEFSNTENPIEQTLGNSELELPDLELATAVSGYHTSGNINSKHSCENEYPKITGAIYHNKRTYSSRTMYPPTNSTLSSLGQNSVVLIKPSDPNNRELLNNPIELAAVLDGSPFGKYKMKDIRTNKRKNIITAEIENPTKEILQELLSVTCLGKWKVNCSQPNSEIHKYGVISPVSINADLEQIKAQMKVRQSNAEIYNVQRLKRKSGSEWTDSVSLKITFTGDEIPESVSIAHSIYKVRPYVGEPIQCYKCQRLGHVASSCRGKTRCLLCAGDHPKDQCRVQGFHCANCQGNHKANSRECQIYEMAHQIEVIRAQQNKTYLKAREYVLQQQQCEIRPNTEVLNKHIIHVDVHQPQNSQTEMSPLYSEMIKKNKRQQYESNSQTTFSRVSPKETRTWATQTEQLDQSHQHELQKREPIATEDFFHKLKNCLLDIFQSSILRESKKAQGLLIENIINNGFNISPRETNDKQTEHKDRASKRRHRETTDEEADKDSVCDGVLSEETVSDTTSLWETVQKTVVKKANQKKSKTDIDKAIYNKNNQQPNKKKKRNGLRGMNQPTT
jgi:hypothetical protein